MSETMKTDELSNINRREFLVLGSAASCLGIAALASTGAIYRYLMPVVSYGIASKFRLEASALPEVGDGLVFPDQKVMLIRKSDHELGVISLVCTHLGCTVARVATGFQCPCHGSQYDSEGVVVGGPAPQTLAWHTVKVLPGNEVEIDTSSRVDENTYYKI
ncbi:MAG TPA: hypothetical protein DCY86_17005 [Bdellovibrionales bacterium]|nr:hypothetical protein [Bdellovibrionales bacterium]